MTSILKTDEIQSQNGGSVVKMQTLKHPSASGNSITLASDGSATIANGTISAGTLGSSVVVPASIGGGMKLTGSYSGNLSGAGYTYLSHGAFSSTYNTYLVLMKGKMTSGSSTYAYLDTRLSKSDSTASNSSYWSVVYGADKDGGGYGVAKNNQSTMVLVSAVDENNHWSAQIYVYNPGTSTETWLSGVVSLFRSGGTKYCIEQSFTGFHSTNYSATGLALTWANSSITSTLDAKFYGITTT